MVDEVVFQLSSLEGDSKLFFKEIETFLDSPVGELIVSFLQGKLFVNQC